MPPPCLEFQPIQAGASAGRRDVSGGRHNQLQPSHTVPNQFSRILQTLNCVAFYNKVLSPIFSVRYQRPLLNEGGKDGKLKL